MAKPLMDYLSALAVDPNRGAAFDEPRAQAAGLTPEHIVALKTAWGTKNWDPVLKHLDAESPELKGRFQGGGFVCHAFGITD